MRELIVIESSPGAFLAWIESDEYQPKCWLNEPDAAADQRRRAFRVIREEDRE